MTQNGRRQLRVRVLLWTRKARNTILSKLEEMSPSIPAFRRALESILDELAKNALKANYKFILIRNRIMARVEQEGISGRQLRDRVEEICNDIARYNEFIQEHPDILENITEPLRAIIDEEAKWVKIVNERKEKREKITDEDKKFVRAPSPYAEIYDAVRERRVYLEIRATYRAPFFWLEVINKAPILSRDLDRIYAKRNEFKSHRDAGTEYEFFLNNMDTSDGGSGFGYATIDSQLAEMGLEPLEHLVILPLHNTNIVTTLNIEEIAARASASA